MATYYGTMRPQVMKVVSWDGDNIQEIKDSFGPDLAPYFFINEENNNLCYGPNIDECNQYPEGTLLTNMGGITTVEPSYWETTYQVVDNAERLQYTITEDAEAVARLTKRS